MTRLPPIDLGVNIDHVATLRQARGTRYPDPLAAARVALAAGGDSITVHLREDRRHIQERDVVALRDELDCRLNLEMAVTEEMLTFGERVRPDDACLVPERRQELTTEGGLDVIGNRDPVARAVERLAAAGIRVSLFIDPDEAQIRCAAEIGAPVIELHTGAYADAPDLRRGADELDRLRAAATLAESLGLRVHAGHGLNYENVTPVAEIPELRELNIGHAIIARAVMDGLSAAVADMRRALDIARAAGPGR